MVFSEASLFLPFPSLMLDFILLGICGQCEAALRVNCERVLNDSVAGSDAVSGEVTSTTGRAQRCADTVSTYKLRKTLSPLKQEVLFCSFFHLEETEQHQGSMMGAASGGTLKLTDLYTLKQSDACCCENLRRCLRGGNESPPPPPCCIARPSECAMV